MAAFDLETTGTDVTKDRIAQAALILIGGNQPPAKHTWTVNPGVPMPDAAAAVHGLTGFYLAEHGTPADEAVPQIVTAVLDAVRSGIVLVGHNIGSYDLNLLNHEARRHTGAGLVETLGRTLGPVVDTMVLDKHVLPYRKRVSKEQGARQLRTLAAVYDLPWDEEAAHGAEYDALKAWQIAWKIGAIGSKPRIQRPDFVRAERSEQFDEVGGITAEELHARQVHWAIEQATSFEAYLRSPKAGASRDPHAVIDGRWPLVPAEEEKTAA
jgi:DNA polymerase-3 subunit epsilon